MLKKYIGTKQFYRMVLAVALPITVQNAITNFVSLLDNIMVGQMGTTQMTGVAVANQLVFVFNLCIFGAVSGAGIFTAQFYGKGDHKGVTHTMRYKLIISLIIAALGTAIFLGFGDRLVDLYLKGEGEAADAEASLACGVEYLRIIVIGLLPFVLVQSYASTLRETGETFVPMLAGIIAVVVNLIFNYILIFGHFGAPQLGAAGAAIATVLSRFVELGIVMIWTHTHTERNLFAKELYRSPKIPAALVKTIFRKGTPLMLNELFWAMGVAVLTQCYSGRGLHVVAALNISSTINNVFNVMFMAIGASVSIIIGQLLGAGKMEEAVDTDRKLIAFTTVTCIGMTLILLITAPLFPAIYNTTDDVRALAADLIRICAVMMPPNAFMNACYFTLRSGGKTLITFFYDSFYICVISCGAAFLLSRFTAMPIRELYFCVQALDIFKCVSGYILVKKRVWVHNIVND